MTIIISAVTPAGIVMGGEGRCILTKAEEFIDGCDTAKKVDFEPITGNVEKVYHIAGRFGLAYSGPDFDGKGWCLQNEINEFDRIVRLNLRCNLSFNIKDAGGIFNGLMKKALPPGTEYHFFWGGYSPRTGKPFQVCYQNGQDVTDAGHVPSGWRTDIPEYPEGCYDRGIAAMGKAEIVRELLDGKEIRWDLMPLGDAVESVRWLIDAVTKKGIQYFEGEQRVVGEDVDILVLTPQYSGFVKKQSAAALKELNVN